MPRRRFFGDNPGVGVQPFVGGVLGVEVFVDGILPAFNAKTGTR